MSATPSSVQSFKSPLGLVRLWQGHWEDVSHPAGAKYEVNEAGTVIRCMVPGCKWKCSIEGEKK